MVVANPLADRTMEIKVMENKVMENKVMENKKKTMKKRNKMTLLNALIQMFAPTETLSLMIIMMAALSMQQHQIGVETTTLKSLILWLCAAFVMVVIALVDKMKKTMANKRVMTKKRRMMAKKKKMMVKKRRMMAKKKRMMAKKMREMTKKKMMAKKKREMTKKKMMVKKKRMMAKKAMVMAQSLLSALAHAKAKTSNAGWTASSA